MSTSRDITASLVSSWLDYDADTGAFVWRHRPDVRPCDNSRRAGKVAGKIDTGGYRQIYINGSRVSAHRLAWLVVNGRWPTGQIDHINGDRSDNRIVNLRQVKPAENSQNMAKAVGKTSRWLGVNWDHRQRKWCARITYGGRTRFLGWFRDELAARDAYRDAKFRLHYAQPEVREGADG